MEWKYKDESEWKELFDLNNLIQSEGNNEEPDLGYKKIIKAVNDDTDNFGCVDENELCDNGTKITIEVGPGIINDFYVINDNEYTMTLISANNIGGEIDGTEITTVRWNEGVSGNTGSTAAGPTTALEYLNSLTSEWTNIDPIKSYEFEQNSGSSIYKNIRIINGLATITNNTDNLYSVPGISRARLLTYQEAQNLGCKSTNSSCPSYLYANLDGTTNSLRPYGYWLLTAKDTKQVYVVRNTGAIKENATTDNTGRGIRPVINLYK